MPLLPPRRVTTREGERASQGGREVLGACVGGRTRLIARVVTSIYDEALRPSGLQTGQLTMLAITARVERVRPKELVELLAMDKSTVSRNVKILVDHGWLERIPEPKGRGYSLELTDAGQEKLVATIPLWRRAQEVARKRLDAKHFEALKDLGDAILMQTEYAIDIEP